MKRFLILMMSTGLLLTACAAPPTPAVTATPLLPTPPPTHTPIPPTAIPTPGSPYADVVVEYNQGPITGSSLNVGYHPEYIVGPPDVVLDPCCTGLLPLGTGGSITVEFTDNSAVNGPGPDLSIVGDPDNDEHVRVEASADGTDWKDFGIVSEMAELDLQDVGLEFARYVRITDDAVAEATGNNSAEIDAVEALHSGPPPTM